MRPAVPQLAHAELAEHAAIVLNSCLTAMVLKQSASWHRLADAEQRFHAPVTCSERKPAACASSSSER